MIGQAIQKESDGNPSSQNVVMTSTTGAVATANPMSLTPRHRPDTAPRALVSSVVAM